MNIQTPSTDRPYILRDVVNYSSVDSKGVKPGKVIWISKAVADQLNYARALNGSPLRLAPLNS